MHIILHKCFQDIQLVNLFCGIYGSTCSNAYDNLYANSICRETIENEGLGFGRDILCYNMTCWTLLNNTYTACNFLVSFCYRYTYSLHLCICITFIILIVYISL